MLRALVVIVVGLVAPMALADGLTGSFASIDGGELSVEEWRGRPVLVVNTASKCGYTYQYEGMQALYDRYRDRGLVVLAVPSDDFNQELGSASEIKEFCELTYGLDFPMTDITPVTGAGAHPFFAAVRAESGFAPRWNFNKILLGPDGQIVATWRSSTRPQSAEVMRVIEGLLN